MKPIFEIELKKLKNIKILSFLNKLTGISEEEKKQLKLIVLWKSIESFNPDKGCLFSTHLYNMCRYEYLNHINSKENKKRQVHKVIDKPTYENQNILMDLPEQYSKILEEKYIYKYSIKELCSIYNTTDKEINKLLSKAKEYLKNYINNK